MYLVGAQCKSDVIYVAIILLDQDFFKVKSDAMRLKSCDSFLYLDGISESESFNIDFFKVCRFVRKSRFMSYALGVQCMSDLIYVPIILLDELFKVKSVAAIWIISAYRIEYLSQIISIAIVVVHIWPFVCGTHFKGMPQLWIKRFLNT